MQPDYCLPIQKSQKDEILEVIQANDNQYRYFEIWLDYIYKVDDAFVAQLVELLGDRLIVLFRRQNLEATVMNQEQRLTLLDSLQNTSVLVDLDVSSQQIELDHVKDQGLAIQLIASYHNYQETPDPLQLEAIIDTMKAYQPAVYKLSTLCTAEQDALRLLDQLLKLKTSGIRAIVLGMGEYGVITRIFGTLWGNEMVFAPQEAAEQSAPGQLTRQQFETIFKELAA